MKQINRLPLLFTIYKKLLIIILLLSFNGFAQEEKIEIVTEILPPYQIYNQDKTVGGVATDIVKELLKITKDEASIRVMPWARAYNIALNKKNILIYSMTRSEDRLDKFYWIGDLFQENVCFWALKTNKKINGEKPLTESELKKSVFVDTRLSVTSNYLLKEGYNNVYLTSNDIQNMEMIVAGRADFILTTEYNLDIVSKKFNLNVNDFQRVFDNKMLSTPLSIAFSRQTDVEIVQRFRSAFEQLKINGTLEKIIKKWKIFELSPRC